jgi:hypothetical protein
MLIFIKFSDGRFCPRSAMLFLKSNQDGKELPAGCIGYDLFHFYLPAGRLCFDMHINKGLGSKGCLALVSLSAGAQF